MKKKNKNKQIKSFDKVIKLIESGTIVYCKTALHGKRKKEDWCHKYVMIKFPDGTSQVLRWSWYSIEEWNSYNSISIEEILTGTWFIKEK